MYGHPIKTASGLSRKYLTNILNGKILYRARTGRGKVYKGEVIATFKAVWREAGCPCTPYPKAEMARWVDEYATQVADIVTFPVARHF